MLKSIMDFFDIVFPLNIGPLTYKGPSGKAFLMPGMLVKAEIKKSVKTGIVIGKAIHPPEGLIKEILDVPMEQPVFSESMLSLLKWISDYYIVPAGLALKSILPIEVFEKGRKRQGYKEKKEHPSAQDLLYGPLPDPDINITKAIRESINRREYKTYLFHAATARHEVSGISGLIKGISNAIVLVPEIAHIYRLYPLLHEIFGERLTVMHGNLSKSQKRDSFSRIITGESDIVLGTRLAVFAPLSSVSLITVLHEHNCSYKNMEGLRYNARDVAVMRGYLNKSTVLLSSTTPSIESFYNAKTGKYNIISSDTRVRRPKVEVVDMRTARKISPYISKKTIDAAASRIKRSEGIFFFINRKGYSMIQCADCNYIEACLECMVPLVYHRDNKILKCHCCGHTSDQGETCGRCKSINLEMVGAGTQRIASDIKSFLGKEPLRLDSDILRESPPLGSLPEYIQKGGVVVGTKIITKNLIQKEIMGLCVFLNPDINLHFPDFRSSELLFQELFNLSEYLTHNGLLIIQTRIPENFVYRYFKKYDYLQFFAEELSRRRTLLYPPFSRLTLITITSKSDAEKEVVKAMGNTGIENDETFEAMGPVRVISRGTNKWKILLKSKTKVRLHIYVHNLLKSLGDKKGLKIITDVDPISM